MANPRKTFIHPGKFELFRERFQVDWLRPPAPQRMKKLSELMPATLESMGVEAADPFTRLRQAWPRVVGPALAARLRPGALNNGTLVLYVGTSIDMMELRPLATGELLRKARLVLSEKEVRQVRLMLSRT
jgi:Dna[CI] antecedent, DciA